MIEKVNCILTNRIFQYLLLAFLFFIVFGCTKDKYYTIPLSSYEVSFTNEKNSTTVKCLDGYFFSEANIVVGQGECQQKKDKDFYVESCDWLTIIFPLKNRSELEIIVDNNTTGNDRAADIEIESPGYHYGSAKIKVIQTK